MSYNRIPESYVESISDELTSLMYFIGVCLIMWAIGLLFKRKSLSKKCSKETLRKPIMLLLFSLLFVTLPEWRDVIRAWMDMDNGPFFCNNSFVDINMEYIKKLQPLCEGWYAENVKSFILWELPKIIVIISSITALIMIRRGKILKVDKPKKTP